MKYVSAILVIAIIGVLGFKYLVKKEQVVEPPALTQLTKVVEEFIEPTVIKKPIYTSGYSNLREEVDERRLELAALYKTDKDSALKLGEAYLNNKIGDDFFGHWYGTVWDFNGITETPNDGLIACGYFISTVLQHAGLKVQRYKLAQQGSANIIKSLSHSENRVWLSQGGYEAAINWVKTKDDGLFVVGLDYHVGFMEKKNGDVYFIHSNYDTPGCVVKETAAESSVFHTSQVYVVGELFQQDDLVRKWLKQAHISTVTK